MFVEFDQDPRRHRPSPGDERATLTRYLHTQRLTPERRCAGLGPADLLRERIDGRVSAQRSTDALRTPFDLRAPRSTAIVRRYAPHRSVHR
ncbi:hypothetical protein [Streptomyces sp. NPDC053427]|uniref:hypothetical protein n=1 Tax=Streptomyces sp. NPDC053427 TaxID=3365701 RepID=UPI0037CE7853